MTQTPRENLETVMGEQRYQTLAFIRSPFRKSELLWTTFEKEAYAIFSTFKRLDYLLSTNIPTHGHTDHRSLLFVFAPHALEPYLTMDEMEEGNFISTKLKYLQSEH